uniref:Uncharacterized protein n=1 Tax=Triticum urartu TaxID=4572 RepID=A0A8R7U8C5_TRIUA
MRAAERAADMRPWRRECHVEGATRLHGQRGRGDLFRDRVQPAKRSCSTALPTDFSHAFIAPLTTPHHLNYSLAHSLPAPPLKPPSGLPSSPSLPPRTGAVASLASSLPRPSYLDPQRAGEDRPDRARAWPLLIGDGDAARGRARHARSRRRARRALLRQVVAAAGRRRQARQGARRRRRGPAAAAGRRAQAAGRRAGAGAAARVAAARAGRAGRGGVRQGAARRGAALRRPPPALLPHHGPRRRAGREAAQDRARHPGAGRGAAGSRAGRAAGAAAAAPPARGAGAPARDGVRQALPQRGAPLPRRLRRGARRLGRRRRGQDHGAEAGARRVRPRRAILRPRPPAGGLQGLHGGETPEGGRGRARPPRRANRAGAGRRDPELPEGQELPAPAGRRVGAAGPGEGRHPAALGGGGRPGEEGGRGVQERGGVRGHGLPQEDQDGELERRRCVEPVRSERRRGGHPRRRPNFHTCKTGGCRMQGPASLPRHCRPCHVQQTYSRGVGRCTRQAQDAAAHEHRARPGQARARSRQVLLRQPRERHGEGVPPDLRALAGGPQHLQGRARAVLGRPGPPPQVRRRRRVAPVRAHGSHHPGGRAPPGAGRQPPAQHVPVRHARPAPRRRPRRGAPARARQVAGPRGRRAPGAAPRRGAVARRGARLADAQRHRGGPRQGRRRALGRAAGVADAAVQPRPAAEDAAGDPAVHQADVPGPGGHRHTGRVPDGDLLPRQPGVPQPVQEQDPVAAHGAGQPEPAQVPPPARQLLHPDHGASGPDLAAREAAGAGPVHREHRLRRGRLRGAGHRRPREQRRAHAVARHLDGQHRRRAEAGAPGAGRARPVDPPAEAGRGADPGAAVGAARGGAGGRAGGPAGAGGVLVRHRGDRGGRARAEAGGGQVRVPREAPRHGVVPRRGVQPPGGGHRRVPRADAHDLGAAPPVPRVAQPQRLQRDDEAGRRRRGGGQRGGGGGDVPAAEAAGAAGAAEAGGHPRRRRGVRVPGAAEAADQGVLAAEAHTDAAGGRRAGQGEGGGRQALVERAAVGERRRQGLLRPGAALSLSRALTELEFWRVLGLFDGG